MIAKAMRAILLASASKAEEKMRVTSTGDQPGLPGNNNFKVFKAGADKLGYKECHTGQTNRQIAGPTSPNPQAMIASLPSAR